MVRRVHTLDSWPAELQSAAKRAALEGRTVSSLMCPACAGGRSGGSTLSVWANGAYYTANCWRASCGYNADVPRDGVDMSAPRFHPRHFTGDLWTPELSMYEWMRSTYGIHAATLDGFRVRQVGARAVLYLPVLPPQRNAEERGGMVRYFDGSTPKAVAYKATDQAWQAWYRRKAIAGVVIVEDQLSAMRCWQLGWTSVALLGTTITPLKYAEIAAHTPADSPILLCLDADATSKAIAAARKYPRLQVRRLERDIKDDTDENVERVLNG